MSDPIDPPSPGAEPPAKRRAIGDRCVVHLEGKIAPQLAAWIEQGWSVVGRQGAAWLLEWRPGEAGIPSSWPRPACLARPARPPSRLLISAPAALSRR